MEELFQTQPQFEKVARRILDTDSTKWTKQILDEFFTEFPYFMSQGVDLQYKKKDENKGYAVGTIETSGLSIPVIVTNFELAGFDVAYKNGITLPLTAETIGSLVNSPSAFKQVVKIDSGSNQVDLLFDRPLVDLQPAPNFGKYSSVLDRISDTITQEHKKDLLDKLADSSIRAGFETNGTIEVLAKIASVVPKSKIYFSESLSKVLPRDIHLVEKVGRFKATLTVGNSEVDDPIVTELTSDAAKEFESIVAVGTEIEKKAVFTSTKGAAFNVPNMNDKLVIMNIDGIRKHAFMDVNVSNEDNCKDTFSGDMPQLEDFGTWTDGNNAVLPFEIVGITKSASNYEIKGFDGTQAVNYIPVRSVEEITPHESEDNTYYIPTKFRFVKVGEATEVEKQGTHREEAPSNYYTKDDVGLYNLQGPVFMKYAENGHVTAGLGLYEARWAALQCRASKGAIEKMGSAEDNVRIPFDSILKAPRTLAKVAEFLQSEYDGYSKTIKVVAQNLIKEAATLSDPSSVDAVLALNMVTKENILEFVHQLPTYEQVLSDLAKLLLTVRLGFSTIPEMALLRAMKGLAKVVEILRGMSKLDKVRK